MTRNAFEDIVLSFFVLLILNFNLLNRFTGMMSGPLGSVNRVQEFLVVRQQRIPCIHTVKPLNSGKHPSLSSRSIRSWGNLVESGLDTRMICYPKIAIISAMSSVKDLACQSFPVSTVLSLFLCFSHVNICFSKLVCI